MATAKLTVASVLSFERKLSNSDALMYSGLWSDIDKTEGWAAIAVSEKDVRGTISNRQKNAIQSDPAKLDAEVQKPNLQTVDVAALPAQHDTLKLSFTLRILGDLANPTTCNDQAYQAALTDTINQYVAEHNFAELAKRYAINLANGRFLWRNRVGGEDIVVKIKQNDNQWTFNGYDYNLRSFDHQNDDLAAVSKTIQTGLLGESYILLTVEAYVKLGAGQEVFPSQELILDSSGKSNKSKTLYQVSGVAAMHSQKVGNALRTIDDWYESDEHIGPISVEPFGSVTSRGKAYRQPKQKQDFYTLFDNWVCKGQALDVEQQHYVIANLIRGGVFGGKSE